jgi:hypothetical protein
MKITITLQHAAHHYTATVDGCEVEIAQDRQWAGSGLWDGGQIIDCPAAIPMAAYEAMEQALRDAITVAEIAMARASDRCHGWDHHTDTDEEALVSSLYGRREPTEADRALWAEATAYQTAICNS